MYPEGSEAVMADIEFSHNMGAYGRAPEAVDGASAPAGTFSTMTNIAGAVVSLALIAGIGVWGYKLMVRDVSGIPVVRAAEGDMRVRPEEPGGQLARHQGLAVNTIAAQGFASGPVDQVVLAPRMAGLTDEDQPVPTYEKVMTPELLAPAADAFATLDPEDPLADPKAALADFAENLPVSKDDAVNSAPANIGDAVLAAAAQALPVAEPAVLTGPGLKVSARPRLRPSDASFLVQKASYEPAATRSEIDPDKIPAGTRLAQLGAFDDPDVARSEWQRLSGRFGDYLNDKSRVVQEARSGGRTFYRLRAMGFRDLNDSRRFCAAFKAEGVDCIPVASK